LAIAYHLSPGLQLQVKTYLSGLWADISDPLYDNFVYSDLTGRRRERYEINNDAGSHAVSNGANFSHTTEPAERLYHLWAYARYVGDWDLVLDHWSSIVGAIHSLDPSQWRVGCLHIALSTGGGLLIGYARITDPADNISCERRISINTRAANAAADCFAPVTMEGPSAR
jgi:hypothetical protein